MSGAAGARRSPRTKLPAGNHIQKGQPPVWRAALFGLCPECGAPTLFDGPVKFRAKCDRSEEHTSELQSLMRISYAVFCLKKKKNTEKKKLSTTTIIDYKQLKTK